MGCRESTCLFIQFECERIMAIPLSDRKLMDKPCWNLEKTDLYYVKSPYRSLFGDSCLDMGPSSFRFISAFRTLFGMLMFFLVRRSSSGVRVMKPSPQKFGFISGFD